MATVRFARVDLAQLGQELARRREEIERQAGEVAELREQTARLRQAAVERRRELDGVVHEGQELAVEEREKRLHLEMLTERAQEELGTDPAELSERLSRVSETLAAETDVPAQEALDPDAARDSEPEQNGNAAHEAPAGPGELDAEAAQELQELLEADLGGLQEEMDLSLIHI